MATSTVKGRARHGLAPMQRRLLIVAYSWHGLSNREIGRRLGLRERAVKNEIAVLYAALGLTCADKRTRTAVLLWQACQRVTGIRLDERTRRDCANAQEVTHDLG